ncbi:MAG: tryptophan synthase subunit beta [Patescibacteria group bacterium]|nr:tryptophan synthase subunit beta [Patescibacteria group bacterium]
MPSTQTKSGKPDLFFDYHTPFDADETGHFGSYGGRYAPEMLIPSLEALDDAYSEAVRDPQFQNEFFYHLATYAGRPTPLYYAENLTKKLGGGKIYLKNEGLNLTGAHKITHCIGQALIARRMGKKRLIADTGAGQHGKAVATIAAKFGFECTVYMGATDVARQRPNVFWMERLGAKVVPVEFGNKTLKDAVNAAMKDWITNPDAHFLLGSTVGPHPYPSMNRDFQSVVGMEVRDQISKAEGKLPDYLIACVGGGSNAMGLFYRFLNDETVQMIGVEAGGRGTGKLGDHAARFAGGRVGVAEGYKSVFLQDESGNIASSHSVSAGLDYPGIGPQLAYLKEKGRIEVVAVTDAAVLEAFKLVVSTEGIIPALESTHAIAHAVALAPKLAKDQVIVVNVSGSGDKDIFIIAEALGDDKWRTFLRKTVASYDAQK